jgi:hypothetical protein
VRGGDGWSGLLRSHAGAEIEILSTSRNRRRASRPASIWQTAPRSQPRAPAPPALARRTAFLLADVHLDERLSPKYPGGRPTLRSKTALSIVVGMPACGVVDARQTLTIGAADVKPPTALNLPLNAPVRLVHEPRSMRAACWSWWRTASTAANVVRLAVKQK